MRSEAKKYLFDIRQAASRIQEFTAGKTFDDDAVDALLRPAVERQFEVLGEAYAQIDNRLALERGGSTTV